MHMQRELLQTTKCMRYNCDLRPTSSFELNKGEFSCNYITCPVYKTHTPVKSSTHYLRHNPPLGNVGIQRHPFSNFGVMMWNQRQKTVLQPALSARSIEFITIPLMYPNSQRLSKIWNSTPILHNLLSEQWVWHIFFIGTQAVSVLDNKCYDIRIW